jgi:hypothetical protein
MEHQNALRNITRIWSHNIHIAPMKNIPDRCRE